MIARRLHQLGLLLFAAAIIALGFFQLFMRLQNSFPTNYLVLLTVTLATFVVFWLVLSTIHPYAMSYFPACCCSVESASS